MNKFHLSKVGYVIGCVLILALGTLALWVSYVDVSQQVKDEANRSLTLQSSLKGAMIEQTLLSSVRHIRFIYATPPIEGLVRSLKESAHSSISNNEYTQWTQRLNTIFMAYAENNPDIVQIRFIGAADQGRELVRVHRREGQIETVKGSDLQQKSQRDYFQKVRALPPEQLYISGISLNREYGEIESPPWPTYRVAQAVYDDENHFSGLIIINFNAQLLLDKLTQHTPADLVLFLLNERGQYLLHPEPNKAFSFEYGNAKNWVEDVQYGATQPSETTVINEIKFETTNEVFNVSEYQVNSTLTSKTPTLTIVAAINHSKINELIRQRFSTSLLFNLGLILLAFVLLTLYRLYSHASFFRFKLQAEFEAIFQGSNDVIISIDAKGRIDSWNHTALTFFKVDDTDMQNANISHLIQDSEALGTINSQIKAVFKGEKVDTLEMRIRSKKSPLRVMSLAFSPVRLGSTLVSSVSVIFRDVTDASRLRKSLQRSNKKLESRNEEMQAFLYTVSHDLKSPLVTIGGFADRIIDSAGDALDDKNRHRLSRIRSNVEHMSKLLSELLNLARIVRQQLQIDNCLLKNCIEKAQQSLNQSIMDANAKFEVENGEQSLQVNSQLFVQCLQNLMSNAINYADPSRPIAIKIRSFEKNNLQCVSVTDNGIGIEAKHHEKIFKIFERLDVGNGSGVGLAIVKTIMDKHQGRVEVMSKRGEGSTFTLCFPKANGEQSS